MRVLVCGGRAYSDKRSVYHVLDRVALEHPVDCIISGCASGADSLAIDWADDDVHHPTVFVARFPADWRAHGRSAGPIRNQRMVDEGKPDLVVAFPGGRGTADMVRRAEAAGVPVLRATSLQIGA